VAWSLFEVQASTIYRMSGEDAARCCAQVELRYRRVDGSFAQSSIDRVSVDELVSGRPVRDFRWYRGRQFYSGWYWSATTETLVAYESRLELARITLADFDPSVVSIAAQPFQLTGDDGGRVRRHVPDLLLVNDSGLVTVVDVKPAHRMADAQVAAVFAWTERVVATRGWAFEAWPGADAQMLGNVTFLAGYRRRSVVNESLLPVALDLAARHATVGGLEDALTAHAPLELARPVVLHLLWSGGLRADLDRPLSRATSVTVRAGVSA
jgi:hypothetical protein